jgi:17 kDa outer membrane surface antigen
VIACAALAMAGCSLTMPFEDRSAALKADPEITGSITPRKAVGPEPLNASPFSPTLDEEDWRRQRAALATALDPQGNGALVRWDNPDSGMKGTFVPIGNAYLLQHDICRVFLASVIDKTRDDWFQGTACRVGPGEWRIRDHKPWKKPA